MMASRFGFLLRTTERRVRAASLCAACVFILLLSQSCASAASPAGRAISPLPPNEDFTCFYMSLEDADEIAYRLQKSELIRMLADNTPLFAELRSFLRNLPAKNVALLFSVDGGADVRFQMAWSFKENQRALLDKIAKRTATEDEVMGLLSGGEGLPLLSIIPPNPGKGEPYYRLRPMDLSISACDDLLIFGDDPERIAESAAAARNRARRFSPAIRGEGRNYFWFDMGRALTEQTVSLCASLTGAEEKGASSESIRMEGDLARFPGGWSLDLFTNVVSVVWGRDFIERMHMKESGSFYSAGGGRLLAAIDSAPNLRAFMSSAFGAWLGGVFEKAELELNKILDSVADEAEKERLWEEISDLDRLNAAMTKGDPADTKQLRAYALFSTRTGSVSAIADAVAKLAAKHNAEAAGNGQMIEVDRVGANGWNTVYTLAGLADIGRVTVALGEDRILIGLLSPAELQMPFTAESDLYAELMSGGSRLEMTYLDMRGLRETARAFVSANGQGRLNREILEVLVIPFMDFREIGIESLSVDHVRFKFRTGWLDFDDRAFVEGLFR